MIEYSYLLYEVSHHDVSDNYFNESNQISTSFSKLIKKFRTIEDAECWLKLALEAFDVVEKASDISRDFNKIIDRKLPDKSQKISNEEYNKQLELISNVEKLESKFSSDFNGFKFDYDSTFEIRKTYTYKRNYDL